LPTGNYRSVTLNDQLVERVKQIVRKFGTYHSVSEFISEAVRLRLEAIEKQEKAREAEDESKI
jgi:Arc/MetJ-type ribon-helix-helix transcriptional regulator